MLFSRIAALLLCISCMLMLGCSKEALQALGDYAERRDLDTCICVQFHGRKASGGGALTGGSVPLEACMAYCDPKYVVTPLLQQQLLRQAPRIIAPPTAVVPGPGASVPDPQPPRAAGSTPAAPEEVSPAPVVPPPDTREESDATNPADLRLPLPDRSNP